jgi:predicted O-methyltransferase YrrM
MQNMAKNETSTLLHKMNSQLISALSDDDPPWHMSQSERMSLLGVVSLIRPETVLEIGSNEGGCTKWLSSFSGRVYSVDIVNRLPESIKALKNVSFLHMNSNDAFEYFKSINVHFDLIVIDGDHSYEGCRNDLFNAINCGSIIMCHDSYNPPCRQGYIDAVKSFNNQSIYYNMDFVQGSILNNELWGGLAIVVNDCNGISFIEANNNYTMLQSCLHRLGRKKRHLKSDFIKRLWGKLLPKN